MTEEEFYKKIGEILQCDTAYKDNKPSPYYNRHTNKIESAMTKASRWGGREPGNGRYPGKGIVRIVGDQVHVALRCPLINETYASMEDALKEVGYAATATKMEI